MKRRAFLKTSLAVELATSAPLILSVLSGAYPSTSFENIRHSRVVITLSSNTILLHVDSRTIHELHAATEIGFD